MKKRVLSLFMAFVLCLTLLPAPALAEGSDTTEQKAQNTASIGGVYANGEDTKAPDGKSALTVPEVQTLLDALPAVSELDGMDGGTLGAVYMDALTAYDAYEALTEEQQAQITGAERFEELFNWFNRQAAPLAESVTIDAVDADGNIITGTNNRTGSIYTGKNGDETFTDSQFYVIRGADVIINGSLTIGGGGGLILCKGAKLTVNGALIHSGGNAFCIYGESDSGKDAGQLVINNSSGTGAAIRSTSASAPRLEINSGEVTIISSSNELVDNVELWSTKPVHKGTLDGNVVSPTEWGKASLDGGKLVLAYCEHNNAAYVSAGDTQHKKNCADCGFVGTAKDCGTNGSVGYVSDGADGHYQKCVCGNTVGSLIGHTIEAVPKDGSCHIFKCRICGYEKAGTQAHITENGTCTLCGFTYVANAAYEDYASVKDAIDALIKNNATNYVVELCSFSKIVDEAIVFDYPGTTITLDMAGCTLTNQNAVPLTVKSGTLRIKGDANIKQTGTSEDTYKPAIEVTGGSLVFENALTAQGGKYEKYDRQPAVKATGGTVEFKGALALDGGLLLDDCARLASKLTQGKFYSDNNGQGQVYRVQTGNSYQHSYDFLADGCAFAEYNTATGKAEVDENEVPVIVNAYPSGLLNKNVIIVPHTHSIAEGQDACACGKQFEAGIPADDGTITYYETIDEAFAHAKAGETVKLLIDSDKWSRPSTIYVVGGPYIFDLNGHKVGHRTGDDDFNQAFLQVGDQDGNPGTLTILDSSDAQTGYFYELILYNGSLTVESGSFYQCWPSGGYATGTITFQGGTVDKFTAVSKSVETKLYGGAFGAVYNNIGGKPGDLLADNKAFFDRDSGNLINGYDDNYNNVLDVVVKDHKHALENGSCACGFTCAHDWSDKNGVCKKADCGYHCPHNAGATETDGVYAGDVCGQTVTAKVVASNGTTTYYADGYINNNPKSGLYFAIQAAESGSTVAALGGEYLGGYVTGGKTLTLDVSNGKTISGILNVGYTNPSDTGNKLIVIGGAELTYVIVDPGNTLDLTGWTGEKIWSLTVSYGGNATLNGGTFAKLNVNGVEVGSLLFPGYALQYVDGGAYVEYSSTSNMENVRVVKCPHSDATLEEDRTGATCKYCGASFAATVNDAPYDTVAYAASAWLANGGTLKLYADGGSYSDVDFSSGADTPFVIDLNGFAFDKAGQTIRLSGGKSLTIMDSREKATGNGTFSPVTADSGTLIMEGGYLQGLTVPSGSTADIKLRGGRVHALDCPVPVFNLLEDGYALMNGNITVDPTSILSGTTQTYNVNNAKIVVQDIDRTATVYSGQTTVPFPVSLTTTDGEIGLMQFKWYVVKDDGTVAELTETDNVGPQNGAYSYAVTTDGSGKDGWAVLEIGKTYDVICVVNGKTADKAYRWQTPLTGFQINVERTDLANAEIKFSNTNHRVTFNPFGNTIAEPSKDFDVICNGRTLVYGTDYTVTGNTANGIGYYELTIGAASNSYTGEKTVNWEVIEYMLSGPLCDSMVTKQYDGTTALSDSFVSSDFRSRDEAGKTIRLVKGTDYIIFDVQYLTPDAGANKEIAYKLTLLNRNYRFSNGAVTWDDCDQDWPQRVSASITQADAPAVTKTGELTIVNKLTRSYTFNLADLLPTLPENGQYGTVEYGNPVNALGVGSYIASVNNTTGELTLKVIARDSDEEGQFGTITVPVTTTNYQGFELVVHVSAENKLLPEGQPTLSKTELTYGDALNAIALSGALQDKTNNVEVPGTFAWADGTIEPAAGTYSAEWIFTPTDTDTYLEARGTADITVNKATPIGAPKYTAITASGKTLADAALAVNESWPGGTVQWVDADGTEMDVSTEVKANTAYKWRFTPTDSENYNILEGSIKLYSVSTGGGGGTVTPSTTTETETTTDPDGTVTKTETKSDGSTVETVTKPDGSTTTTETKTETKPDGSTTTTETKSETSADGSKTETKSEITTAADGSKTETKSETKVEADGTKSETKAETKTDANGVTSGTETTQTTTPDGSTGTTTTTTENGNSKTEAEAKISEKAVEDAKQSGEAVKVPTEVRAGESSNSAPTVKVELPKDAGETKIEIPVSDVNSGTVAVIVHEDGTEEIVKDSTVTENGVVLGVEGNTTVKIIDNSKTFIDTENHWSRDEVNFVASRELFNGIGNNLFGVSGDMTRGMVNTVLARLAGVDTTPKNGQKWYEVGTEWAKTNGITDGSNPEVSVTREQLAAMLYRFAGSPEVNGELSFADADRVSGYAENALLWAVQNGIMNGVGNERIAPRAEAQRAQVAAMMARYLKNAG